ncbi:hypothetical protein DPMN_010263 [Dreissena polymorpha]|uniref:Uncharacterized protein n=1 Tax=Dreissena polymorpha TaxID=45954 RepID=A0A9D4RZ24_DREPO|nr:hypothetical protein DPMN_010263 [Dreissena polymorpha]
MKCGKTTRKHWSATMNRMVTIGETVDSLTRQHLRVLWLGKPKYALCEKDTVPLARDRFVET